MKTSPHNVGVVVLFSRPWLRDVVLENFERQTFKNKELIVVENNRALGAWHASGTVVQSQPHRTHARNAGMAACRQAGHKFYAIFEDDDWYGPDYLNECWEYRGKGHVLGQSSFVIEDPTGGLWRTMPHVQPGYIQQQPGFTGGLLAATLFGLTEKALEWRAVIPIGEEIIWYTEMLAHDRLLWGMGPGHFRLRRYSDEKHDHTVKSSWKQELQQLKSVPLTKDEARALRAI